MQLLLLIYTVSTINWEVWPKSNFQYWLAWIRPYKSRIGSKQGENMIFKSLE